MNELKSKSKVFVKSFKMKKYEEELENEGRINDNAQLRISKCLNLFTVLLFSQSMDVQSNIFIDLESILRLNDRNKKIFIETGFQELIIQILMKLSTEYKVSNNQENLTYIERLMNLLEQSLIRGVETGSKSMMSLCKLYERRWEFKELPS